MFVSQYVCLIAFTLLYLVSYLNTECSAFHTLEYSNSYDTSRIKRQSCGFRCANGECISRHEKCDGKFDCSDNSDELSEICGSTAVTPSVTPPTLADGSCALPPQPANGKYAVDKPSTMLTYSCSPGYQIYPSPKNNVAMCDSGKWYPALPECLRTCGPRISDSVDTYCEHTGIKVNCSKFMVEGTTVQMKCKHLYSQVDSSANSISVCRNGSWDYSFIECVPECGNLVPEGATFIVGGENAKKSTFPWHVGIYKLTATNQYKQQCGGSIISRKVILSAAHCFTAYADGAPYDVKQYAIAAGKYYRDYYDERDTLSQTSTVKEIIIPRQYKGLLSSFTADIAFVLLDKAFEMTHLVQPVCIDWNTQYDAAQLKENNKGIVVGWGYTNDGKDPSAELKQLSVPFVNLADCLSAVPENFIRFLTQDKFCAGFTNGSSVCHRDSGGGLVFFWPANRKYYLRGLVSVGPLKEEACDSRQYSAYTKVSDYMETLQNVEVNTRMNSDKSPEISGSTPVTPSVTPPTLADGSCALPPQPANGKYVVDKSSTMLTYSCSPGYQIYPLEDYNVAVCHLGKWYPKLSECVRTCGPRISDSIETYCEHNGIKVNCSKPMLEGTTVQMKCKHLYSQVDSFANPVSVCRDGSWDYSFIECVPECGNLVLEGDTFIVDGHNVKKGTFPWHVGIYRLNAANQYEQQCGGSIISRKVILSAAHCFTAFADGALHDVKQYAIAAGKYYRDYYEVRDTLSQTSTVKEIIIPPQYKGLLTSFKGDIAFVILDKAFEITHVVQPVCIDWNNKYEAAQFKENNIGTVVGWGFTNEGKDPSAELKQLSVPLVNLETCISVMPKAFIRFLTSDKFCAGFTNGSSVCQGDGGGGLVFLWPDNKKYYLRGSVSVGPVKEGTCDSRQYGAYTNVSDYMETLRTVVLSTRV